MVMDFSNLELQHDKKNAICYHSNQNGTRASSTHEWSTLNDSLTLPVEHARQFKLDAWVFDFF